MNICNICMTGSRGILGAPIPSWRLFGPHDDNDDSPPESKPTQSGPAPPLYHWSPPSCNCLKLKNQKCVKLELISFYDWFAHWQNSDFQPLLTLVDCQNPETLISSIPGLVVWQNQKMLWGECQMWVWRTSGGKVTLDQVSLGIAQSQAPLSIPMLFTPRANLKKYLSFSLIDIIIRNHPGNYLLSIPWLSPEISILSPVGSPAVTDHPELLPSLLPCMIIIFPWLTISWWPVTVSDNRDVMVDGGEVSLILKDSSSIGHQLVSNSHTLT